MTREEIALQIAIELVRKSGVREALDFLIAERISLTASFMAEVLLDPFGELSDMPNKILLTEMDGTPKQIVFADHAGDFSPTGANDLRKTTDGSQELDVQLSMASVANGSYRQSAKFDFGENWARLYKVRAAMEFAATPTAGRGLNLFLAASHSATAGTGNDAAASGSDAAYTGYASNAAAAVLQADDIGAVINTANATATIQIASGRTFMPTSRYANLIVHNDSGAAAHSDDVEWNIVFNPITEEVQ